MTNSTDKINAIIAAHEPVGTFVVYETGFGKDYARVKNPAPSEKCVRLFTTESVRAMLEEAVAGKDAVILALKDSKREQETSSSDTINSLRATLATEQATALKMREALSNQLSPVERTHALQSDKHSDSCAYWDDAEFCTCGSLEQFRIDKALAIPLDTQALREICLRVASERDKASAMGYMDAAYQESDEEIVNRILGEKA